MYFTKDRIDRIIKELGDYIYPNCESINTFMMKEGASIDIGKPDSGTWMPFQQGIQHCTACI